MKIKEGIKYGFLLWILIFVEISIFKIGLKLETPFWQIIHYILLIPITIYCCKKYYKTLDQLNGFLLGLFFLIIGTILDLVITIPFFLNKDYVSYYSDFYLLVGFLELIIISGFYKASRRGFK